MAADVHGQVERLTGLAREAGLDGVVCSGAEVAAAKAIWPEGFFVVPGVRPADAHVGDQKRVVTPAPGARSRRLGAGGRPPDHAMRRTRTWRRARSRLRCRMGLIRPFVPARDHALSIAFYQAIGFALLHRDEGVAILEQEGASFLLQNHYTKAFAENCMLQFFVADLDGWWTRTDGLVERFGVQTPAAPKMQDWGIRVGFLFDPSGVLWQVSQP